MGSITRALVCAIAVGVWGIAQAASIGSSQSPADATLEQAALYLDNSSVRLDELVSAIHTEAGDSEVDEALFQYVREFSQCHRRNKTTAVWPVL